MIAFVSVVFVTTVSAGNWVFGDSCVNARDGKCQENGTIGQCGYGTDSADCGPVCASKVCSNECVSSSDTVCDDGGVGSYFSSCSYGTDCNDCGVRLGETTDCFPSPASVAHFYELIPAAVIKTTADLLAPGQKVALNAKEYYRFAIKVKVSFGAAYFSAFDLPREEAEAAALNETGDLRENVTVEEALGYMSGVCGVDTLSAIMKSIGEVVVDVVTEFDAAAGALRACRAGIATKKNWFFCVTHFLGAFCDILEERKYELHDACGLLFTGICKILGFIKKIFKWIIGLIESIVSNLCLSPNSRVLTPDGVFAVSEVARGQKVHCPTGWCKVVIREHIHDRELHSTTVLWNNGKKLLEATNGHWVRSSAGDKMIKDIVIGDVIAGAQITAKTFNSSAVVNLIVETNRYYVNDGIETTSAQGNWNIPLETSIVILDKALSVVEGFVDVERMWSWVSKQVI